MSAGSPCPAALHSQVAETIVINPPRFTRRRAASEALCSGLGLSPVRFSEGITGDMGHQRACTLAHRQAMAAARALPCLVLEDDLQLAGRDASLPPLPGDADLVYLSVSAFGCLPWTRDALALAWHRALQGLTLASVHDAHWLRLHSMSGGQAILYVTERGRAAWLQATRQAVRFGGPFDVFTAYAMRDVTVYAPHAPLFCEAPELQRDDLRRNARLLQQRLGFTRTPLVPRVAGDRTSVRFGGRVISVQVVEQAPGRLEWQVIDVAPAPG